MTPVCSGSISSVDQLGAVHPQPATIFIIFKGSSPLLEYLKSILCGPFSSWILPKSYSKASNSIIGKDINETQKNIMMEKVTNTLIYFP